MTDKGVMSNRVFSEPEHEKSIVRQLKIIIVVLVLSNIALGGFGFYFLRAVDRKYSDLIDQAVPTLNDMQTLTAISMEAMRSTNPTLFGESPQSRSERTQAARVALERDRDLRRGILKREWLSRDTEERVDFQSAGEGFSRAAAAVINLLESGKNAAASRQREESLRPAFDRYIAATTKAADVLEAQSLRTSDLFTERTVSLSRIMLGLASWPVMILGIFLLVTAVFIIAVLLKVSVFRHESI
jgi:Four helix bundle sensory module for signal transduction